MSIHIIGPRESCPIPEGAVFVNTTSRSKDFGKGFSPFYLGPCKLYGDYVSQTFENAWQYLKVYKCHVGPDGEPTEAYWRWADIGWSKPWADRYPMGKGAKPEYMLWNGQKLGYIDSRHKVYVPLYYKAVKDKPCYLRLKQIYEEGQNIYLWDFDGYDYEAQGMTLKDALNNPNRCMGHAFVIAAMLEKGM